MAELPDETGGIERPTPGYQGEAQFGSDVVADALRATGIPWVALNPGASYRGLHDSLVNYLGNESPQMLVCLHEETAVAIAHGHAKAGGSMMAAAVHSNIGLMHATMAMFNAWCDRVPLMVIGATGPVDSVRRRPWIDWIHTARDQGALVRDYTKWDDQPASAEAAREAVLRGNWIANTAPKGPVYINLDAQMQESRLDQPVSPIDAKRFMPPVSSGAAPALVSRAAELLAQARRPLILSGRASRNIADWQRRVALAESIDAKVLTDLKVGASFPTDHPAHGGAQGLIVAGAPWTRVVSEADVILSLDWVDLDGTLRTAVSGGTPDATVIHVSVDYQMHRGWSMDHLGLPAVDLFIPADPDQVLPMLLQAIESMGPERLARWLDAGEGGVTADAVAGKDVDSVRSSAAVDAGPIRVPDLARALRRSLGSRVSTLARIPLTWDVEIWPFRHPLDYLGFNGGGGLAAGPGIAVGAALALRGSGRICIAFCGDGDFLMGVTALWTAARYRIPLLVVVYNNRGYFDDEMHQDRVARARGRPVENRWIGQTITDPDVDIAGMARAQGATGFGPVADVADLPAVLDQAIAAVEAGAVVVVDVLTVA